MRFTARFLLSMCVSTLCLWAGSGLAQETSAQPGTAQSNGQGYHWPIHYDGPMMHHGSTAAATLPGLPHFHVTFHGGPVQTTTTSYAIYWKPAGSTMRAGYQTVINQFLKDVGGSPLYGYATEYAGSNGRVQNDSKFGGSWVDTTPFPKGGLTDLAIVESIERAILLNGWNIGVNSSFFLMLGSGALSNPQFCAFHSAFQFNNDVVIYGVMPYFTAQDAGGCGAPFGITPNNNFEADTTIGNLTHEQTEMVTDPLLDAWFDPINGEVGDICIFSYGVPITNLGGNLTAHGHAYIVQEEWSEKHHSCQPNL